MKKAVITILVVLLALSLAGCRAAREKRVEELAEKMMEERLEKQGIEADIEKDGESMTITTEEGEIEIGVTKEWPDDTPDDIPRFTKGEVESITTVMGSVIVTINTDSYNDVADYIKTLEQAGWSELLKTDNQDQIIFVGMKDGVQATVEWSGSDLVVAWINVGE